MCVRVVRAVLCHLKRKLKRPARVTHALVYRSLIEHSGSTFGRRKMVLLSSWFEEWDRFLALTHPQQLIASEYNAWDDVTLNGRVVMSVSMCERVDMYEMIITYVNETIMNLSDSVFWTGRKRLTVVTGTARSVTETVVVFPRSGVIYIPRRSWRKKMQSWGYNEWYPV